MTSLRKTFTLLLVLALLAVACRTETTIEPAAGSGSTSGPTATSPAEPVADGADGDEADDALSPTPEPEPDATTSADPQDPAALAPAPFTGTAPEGYVPPSSWDAAPPLDPTVVEGELANGLRYLIKQNGRPGSQAQLRLVVQAGSLNEEPGSEGIAHYLEHMMFNGTERFPGNEIVQVLESFGSGFGPDVNAYTSYGETVYELQLPTRSIDTVQLGLDVLYQWATAATIEPDDVDGERGVIREEHRRSTETLSGRIGEQVREVLFEDTDYLNRAPIGTSEVIESVDATELRAFYEQWYRPELMTVVAVGDFDVAEMERRIASTFVQPASEPRVEPIEVNGGDGSLAGPVYDVLTDSELQSTDIEVLWRLGSDPSTSQAAGRADLVAGVTMAMIGERLFERVQADAGVLLDAGAGHGDLTNSTQIANLVATASSEDVGAAVEELLIVIEQARQFGFSESELERQLTAVQAQVDQAYSERGTRQDGALAQSLVAHALGRDVLLDPDEQLARATEVIDSITTGDAQRFLFEVLESEPYVLITAPAAEEDVLPAPETLDGIYRSIVGFEVPAPAEATTTATQLMETPDPAPIVERGAIAGLDATVVTFDNGATLVYRPTEITENVVLLRASSPGGFFAVDGPEVPLLGRTPSLVAGSGFESVDVVALNQLLAGEIASVSTAIGRSEELVFGEAATTDIETMFQLLHLQMTEPQITELRVRQFDEGWRPLAENPAADPGTAADLELWDLRYGDSPWFRLIPTIADLDNLDPARQLEAYRDRFADAGDFVFAVVGDFDPVLLEDLAARYIGTLPDSGRRETPIDRDPGLPEENLVANVSAGVGDQGEVRINWESPYDFSLRADVTAAALEIVVDARLRDLIREELGASYSPNSAVTVLAEPKPWVDTIIEVETDPEQVDAVSAAVRDELARIRNGEVDARYLELAVEQLVEGYRFFTNNDWLDRLLFHSRYPDRPGDEFRDRTAIAQSLTVADIAAAAEIVFPPTRSVETRLTPG